MTGARDQGYLVKPVFNTMKRYRFTERAGWMYTSPRKPTLRLHRPNQLYDDFWRQGAVATRTQAGAVNGDSACLKKGQCKWLPLGPLIPPLNSGLTLSRVY